MGSSGGKVLAFLLVLAGVHCLEVGFALNEEEFDQFGHIFVNRLKEGEVNSCVWNGVSCEDGSHVSLNNENTIRGLFEITTVTRTQSGSSASSGGDAGSRPKSVPPPKDSGENGHQVSLAPIQQPPSPPPQKLSPPPIPPQSQSPPPTPRPSLPPPPSANPSGFSPKNSNKLLYGLAGGFSGLLILALTVFILFRIKKVSVKPWAPGLSGQLRKAFVTGLPRLKVSELETACENFSNIVGTLTDGTHFYKGTLSSGVEIAVSSIKTDGWSEQSQEKFRNKITTLSKVNHKNFVNLIGYCEDDKPLGRMLVFEYSPNGKLSEHVHNSYSCEYLDWAARMRIAMGVAFCLDHMLRLDPPIVIRKLDSDTIHLTEDFAAKIADLELDSMIEELKMTSSMHGPANVVLLFGMLLLELISGRAPLSGENADLVFWATDYLNDQRPAKEAMDPALGSNVNADVFEPVFNVVKQCLQTSPEDRPLMGAVVQNLGRITSITPEAASPRLSPLWWAELEIISRDST